MADNKAQRITVSDYVAVCIKYLNCKTGKRLSYNSKLTVALLSEIYERGVGLLSIQAVIDKKVEEWSGSDKMRAYLKPSTLFDRCNFWRYLKELES